MTVPSERRANELNWPAATATAVLQVVDAGNYPRAACHPVTAAGLRVYPPNQTRSKIVPFPIPVCSKTSPHILFVGPVKK